MKNNKEGLNFRYPVIFGEKNGETLNNGRWPNY